jgi:hypothetical protein
MWIRFAEMNAISIPEKKAEKRSALTMIKIEVSTPIPAYPPCVSQSVYGNYA